MTTKNKLREFIFGTDTSAGRTFDIILIFAIILCVFTNAGKIIASVIMLMGYLIIAVPTGVIMGEFTRAMAGTKKCKKLQQLYKRTC